MRLKTIFVAAALTLTAGPAAAGPVAGLVISVAGMWAGQAAATALINAGLIAAGSWAASAVVVGIATLVGLAYQILMPVKAPDFPSVNYNSQQPVSYMARIYGEVRTTGTVAVTKFTRVPGWPGKGRKKEYRVYAVIMAAHRVSGVLAWYVDDRLVTLNADDFVVEDPYDPAGDVGLRFHRGTHDQAADELLVSCLPEWTEQHDMAGLAYVVARAKRLEDANFNEIYPNGKPIISPVLRGNDAIYDPRTGATGYTRNWALCFAHELTQYQGREVDWDLVALEADVCDQQVPNGEGSTRPRWSASARFTTDMTDADVRGQFLAAACGMIYETGDGKTGFFAGRWMEPEITLTPADFISYTISETRDIDAADEYISRYIEPDRDYVETPSGVWRQRDGRSRKEIKTPMVSSHHQAVTVAKQMAASENARYQLSGTLKFVGFSLRGKRFVRFDDPDSGISFAMQIKKLALNEGWMTWQVEGVSSDPGDWMVGEDEFPPRPVYEKLTSDAAIDPVDGFTVVAGASSSGAATMIASWAAQDGSYRQRLRYSVAGSEMWQIIDVPRGATRYEQSGLVDRTDYEWQILNYRSGKYSAWSSPITVRAVADNVVPPALSDFAVTGGSGQVLVEFMTPNSPKYDAARIYRSESSSFGAAVAVHTEYGSPNILDSWSDNDLDPDTYWYWIEPLNPSGVAGPRSGPLSASAT